MPDPATESLGMSNLVTAATLQGEAQPAPEYRIDSASTTAAAPEPMTSVSLPPTLNIGGKAATALPMHVVWTDWEGRDATDVAACLSGALLTCSNMSLLVAPPAQEAAASLASSVLPNLLQGGSAAVFTSSMYKGGPRLSAKELKQALVEHYASLLPLPSCIRVPQRAAHRLIIIINPCKPYLTASAPRLTHWGGGK
jgi:hypothetical protein